MNVPVGSGSERLKGPILSKPKKPPSNTLFPSASFLLTHHVKLRSNFWKTLSRKSRSSRPNIFRSILKTRKVDQAWTGGLTSEKFHSYAGSAPSGFMYHSRVMRSSCFFAKLGSTMARGMQWKAVSHLKVSQVPYMILSTHVANHGYSHLSGMDRMSLIYMCFHSCTSAAVCSLEIQQLLTLFLIHFRSGGGGGWPGSPSIHSFWMNW